MPYILLLHKLVYLSSMCVIPSILLPSNNSVQISAKRSVSSKIQYLPGQTQNQYPPNVKQHTGSSAVLPMTLAYALQLSSVITELKQRKKKFSFGCVKSIRNALQCCDNNLHTSFRARLHDIPNSNIHFTGPNVNIHMITDFKEWYL